MNEEEMFPEESLLDAELLFDLLRKRYDFDPENEELEWVFAAESRSDFDDESMSSLFEAFTEEMEEDEPNIRAEVHEVAQDEGHAHDNHDHNGHDHESGEQSGWQLLLVYTGVLSESDLKAIHGRLAVAAETIGAQYVGAECGEVGEMDGMKVNGFIDWTEAVVEVTASFSMSDLSDDIAKKMRDFHIAELTERGLQVADWMPTATGRGLTELRPKDEIVRRLMAAFASVAWVCAPAEVVSDDEVKQYVASNNLTDSFSQRESEWMNMSREQVREFAPLAGWITENMWGLAWLLDKAPIVCACDQQIPEWIQLEIRDEFMSRFEKRFDDLMSETSLQPIERTVATEDFLYCAHNGFRSAEDVELAGLVQERRQPLTWALSPGVAWDETDVST